jgi:hypothetical protein
MGMVQVIAGLDEANAGCALHQDFRIYLFVFW